MLSRIVQFIIGRKNQDSDITNADLDRMDVAYDEVLTVLDCEKVMVEDGEVVGTTGILGDQNVIPTRGRHPAGYLLLIHLGLLTYREQPSFEQDKFDILTAGKCTTFVIIEEPQQNGTTTMRQYGTAFFVAEKYLLTAGHNVVDRHGGIRHPRITYPGLKFIDSKKLREGKIATLECTVIETLHRKHGPYTRDIAILKCAGHNAAYYLPISAEALPPAVTVDIVGYPGAIKEEWIERHQNLTDYVVSKRDTEILLPTRSLTVTRGTVEGYTGVLIAYKISTCPGLSGACMLYKGKVYGVHVGQDAVDKEDSLPLALSFIHGSDARGSEVYRLLRNHSLL